MNPSLPKLPPEDIPRPKTDLTAMFRCELATGKALGRLGGRIAKCLNNCMRDGLVGTEVNCEPTTNSDVGACVDRAIGQAQRQIDRDCADGPPACLDIDRKIEDVELTARAINLSTFCASASAAFLDGDLH
jgi:hypothetical protein